MATDKTVGNSRANVRSVGTRHSPVTPKIFPQPARFVAPPPSSLPRFAASDDGGFERSELPARLSPGMQPANWVVAADLRADVTCPPGSTGAAEGGPALGCASRVGLAPPWRARPWGLGGQLTGSLGADARGGKPRQAGAGGILIAKKSGAALCGRRRVRGWLRWNHLVAWMAAVPAQTKSRVTLRVYAGGAGKALPHRHLRGGETYRCRSIMLTHAF